MSRKKQNDAAHILPRDNGGGGPPEGWWRGRPPRQRPALRDAAKTTKIEAAAAPSTAFGGPPPPLRGGGCALLAALVIAGSAYAQTPQPPAAAGQVPTLSQQPSSVTPDAAGGEPGRAPGSKADQGTDMPKVGDDSGTTTSYATQDDTDTQVQWPCAQARVSTISAGTIWSGPDLAQGKDWEDDNKVAELAQKLASRRTSLDEANDLVVAFAKDAGQDKAAKDKQLTELFVGTLDIINTNRSQILDGIMRYARGQARLARRISDESDKISQAQDDATAKGLGVARDQTNTDFAWDERIFKERKQALSYVCETPSLLERRAYEIAKRIQAQI